MLERRRSDLRATAARAAERRTRCSRPSASGSISRPRALPGARRATPATMRSGCSRLARQLAHVSPVAHVARMRARLDAVGAAPLQAVCRAHPAERGKPEADRPAPRGVAARRCCGPSARGSPRRTISPQRVAERLAPAFAGPDRAQGRPLSTPSSKLFDSLNYKSVLAARLCARAGCGRAAVRSAACRLWTGRRSCSNSPTARPMRPAAAAARPKAPRSRSGAVAEQGALVLTGRIGQSDSALQAFPCLKAVRSDRLRCRASDHR